jgi:hypothetical protein
VKPERTKANRATTIRYSHYTHYTHCTKANRATTIRTSGEHLVFRRLSFANNGDAQSFNAAAHAAPASLVELCHFESQLAIQDDGSFVEGGGTGE